MRRSSCDISAGAVLLLAALYFFLGDTAFFALLAAAAVHECGHILALKLCGARITGFRLDVGGAVIHRRSFGISALKEVVCAAAGPVFGATFAFAASFAGNASDSRFFHLCSGVSWVLSLFNLLPAPPLDGGRIAGELLGERAAALLGLAVSLALLAFGIFFALRGLGIGLLLSAIWLLAAQAGL